MQRREDERRALDVVAMNANPLTKAIDLLRFIPFRLSISPDDDFLVPNYLQPDYNRSSAEAHAS